jgi:hypothetical protein
MAVTRRHAMASPNLTKGETMAAGTQMGGERIWNGLRLAGWGGAAAILLLPLVAMRYTKEVDWSLSDFIVMGALLGGSGLVLELATRRATSLAYRFGVAVAVAAAFLLVWVNLAVGFLGDEGNPANLMFLGVIAVAIAGALAARSRPAAMTRAMLATAATQVLAGSVGFGAGWAAPGGQGTYEVAMGTSLFTALWLLAAWLFRKAA